MALPEITALCIKLGFLDKWGDSDHHQDQILENAESFLKEDPGHKEASLIRAAILENRLPLPSLDEAWGCRIPKHANHPIQAIKAIRMATRRPLVDCRDLFDGNAWFSIGRWASAQLVMRHFKETGVQFESQEPGKWEGSLEAKARNSWSERV